MARYHAKVWGQLKHRRRFRHNDLDLTPMLTIILLIVPVLLFNANFLHLAVLQNVMADHELRGGGGALRPGLVVQFNADGYALYSRYCDLQAVLERGEVKAGHGQNKLVGLEFTPLQELLKKVKQVFPTESNIILAPQSALAYQQVISTMDVVRPFFPNIAFAKYNNAGW